MAKSGANSKGGFDNDIGEDIPSATQDACVVATMLLVFMHKCIALRNDAGKLRPQVQLKFCGKVHTQCKLH